MPDIFSLSTDVLYVIAITISAIVKASGVTVRTGTTGLLYTVGRIDRPIPLILRPLVGAFQKAGKLQSLPRGELKPGFHPLIPFLQRARRVPTRSRSMDLPAQKVATFEGYVFIADANVIFRIVDIRRALIMVDDLLRGMEQMLTLGVQEVLREARIAELQSGEGLDEKLRQNLEKKLRVWGVTVERAGFPSISPSPRTLRITQLRETVLERGRRVEQLQDTTGGARSLSTASALGAIGTRRVFRTKARARRRFAFQRKRALKIRGALERRGLTGSAIDRALRSLRRRSTSSSTR